MRLPVQRTSYGERPVEPTTTVWPELPYTAWRDTCATLQLWTQIVGKIRLAQTPWLNHSWHATLYVTSRGLTTSHSLRLALLRDRVQFRHAHARHRCQRRC